MCPVAAGHVHVYSLSAHTCHLAHACLHGDWVHKCGPLISKGQESRDSQVYTYMREMRHKGAGQGVQHLHEQEPAILHCNLKSSNILVDAAWHCKLSDFNLSQTRGASALLCHNAANSPAHLAPEVHLQKLGSSRFLPSLGVSLFHASSNPS